MLGIDDRQCRVADSRVFCRLPFAACYLITVFALLSVLTTDNASATYLESDIKEPGTERSAVPGRIFSTNVDIFLGQKSRRRTGGGRAWANVYYGDTTLKPKEADKIRPDFYGAQVGFDIVKRRGTYSTLFFNLNQSKTGFDDGTSKIDNFLVGYGQFYSLSMCHFAFNGGLGYDRYQLTAGEAGKGDGLQTNFYGEFGLDYPFGKWFVKPFYALQYDFLYQGTIARQSSVLRRESNDHGLTQLFGLRLNWQVTQKLEFQSRAIWVHEMLDNPPPFYHMRFSPVAGINTPAIMFYEGNTGRDWAWLGIGGKFEGIYNVYLFFDYDILLNERHITHLGSIGLCLGW